MNALQPSILQILFDAVASATGNSTAYALPALASQVTWQTSFGSAPASITLQLQTSLDNLVWSTISSSTSTTGESLTIPTSALFIRARINAVSGGSGITVTVVAKTGVIGVGDATFSNLTVNGNASISGSLAADGLAYPTADGTNGQVLSTDGAGHLSFIDANSGNSYRVTDVVPITVNSPWFIAYSSDLNRWIASSGGDAFSPPLAHSDDGGLTWTTSGTFGDSNFYNSAIWSHRLGKFIAVSETDAGNDVSLSPDGIVWTPTTTPGGDGQRWEAITDSGSLFVAVSDGATAFDVMTSANGLAWTKRATDTLGYTDVVWFAAANLFVAVTPNGTASTTIITSPDGITWTPRTIPTLNSRVFRRLIVTPTSVIAVSAASSVALAPAWFIVSTDGINWSNATANNYWRAVNHFFATLVYDPARDLVVAVEDAFFADALIGVSTDRGANWTTRIIYTPTSGATSSPFCSAYGNGQILVVNDAGQISILH